MNKLRIFIVSLAVTLLQFVTAAPVIAATTGVSCFDTSGTIAADVAFTKTTKVNLQTALNQKSGSKLQIDGIFGNASCTTLKNYLVSKGAISSTVSRIHIGTITSNLLGVKLVTVAGQPTTNIPTPCGNYGKCIFVHKINGKNTLELYDTKTIVSNTKSYKQAYVVAKTLVNTGLDGMRTRNGSFTIYSEMFSGDGVKISRDDNGNAMLGRMGDPHKFSGGQAFHWRVNYGSAVGNKMTKDTAVTYGTHPEYENAIYTGGYASHGCVHTPRSFMQKYDSTFFKVGTVVKISDQPLQ